MQPELELQKQRIIDTASRIYANKLTEAELRDIATFFRSPSGKRYVETQPQVLDDMVQAMQTGPGGLGIHDGPGPGRDGQARPPAAVTARTAGERAGTLDRLGAIVIAALRPAWPWRTARARWWSASPGSCCWQAPPRPGAPADAPRRAARDASGLRGPRLSGLVRGEPRLEPAARPVAAHPLEFLPALLGAYLVARLAPPHLGAVARPAAWVMIATCAYVVADLASGLVIREALGLRVAAFAFNRPLLVTMLLAFPWWPSSPRPGGAAWRRSLPPASPWRPGARSAARRCGARHRRPHLRALRWLPARAGLGLTGAALLGALVLAPVEGDLLARTMPEALHQRLAGSSTRARVAIARSFGAAVAADPWRGAGYGTSGRFQDTPAAERIEPEMRVMLAVGHPHKQLPPGLGRAGRRRRDARRPVLVLTLRALSAWRTVPRSTALALLACAGIVAFVEHGAWQAWWTAGVGAAIAWLRALQYQSQDLTDER